MIDLNVVWFGLVGILLTGYAILDGFDLGTGALHLLTKQDEHRRLFLNAIGPVWDGNEVWLVTGGGALFAAFPEAYATLFSGFYAPFMLLLFALIFRAAAIEFRSKQPMAWWRRLWDACFAASSILASLLLGVALGNILWGIPLDSRFEFTGSAFRLLHPYALLVGITTVALFTMHGAIFLLLKTEGELQRLVRGWARNAWTAFAVCCGLVTVATVLLAPHLTRRLAAVPVLLAIPLVIGAAVAVIPQAIRRGRDGLAFLASSATVAGLMALAGAGIFPSLVLSRPNPQFSLTIYNAASSPKTLGIMLVIAVIGMPLVLAYTAGIYYVFRGKVKLETTSY